jgi:hypothetical protein
MNGFANRFANPFSGYSDDHAAEVVMMSVFDETALKCPCEWIENVLEDSSRSGGYDNVGNSLICDPVTPAMRKDVPPLARTEG